MFSFVSSLSIYLHKLERIQVAQPAANEEKLYKMHAALMEEQLTDLIFSKSAFLSSLQWML